MAYGPLVVFTVTMPSAGTLTSALSMARSWKTVYLAIPSMTSNSEIYINGAIASDGTFRQTYHPMQSATAPSGFRFKIHSAMTNCFVPIPNGFPFIKIETSATIDSGVEFKIICSD